MGETRAAIAVAVRELRTLSRYRMALPTTVVMPLYQSILPTMLFGAAFAVGGRMAGLEDATGTGDLAGFVFLGGAISAAIFVAFWTAGFSIRMEMETGTLEPSLLAPVRPETLVVGKLLSGAAVLLVSQAVLFAIGGLLFGLRLGPGLLAALPALAVLCIGVLGVAFLTAAAVLLLREANLFTDVVGYLVTMLSGVAFPVTLLPGALAALAYLLPTTHGVDIVRALTIGTRPLLDVTLGHVALVATSLLTLVVGLAAFRAAFHRVRTTGAIGQY